MAEQPVGLRTIAIRNQRSNSRTRNTAVSVGYVIDGDQRNADVVEKLAHQRNVALTFVAEAEVAADDHALHAQTVDENVENEFARAGLRYGFVERDEVTLVETALSEEVDAFFRRANQRRFRPGTQE